MNYEARTKSVPQIRRNRNNKRIPSDFTVGDSLEKVTLVAYAVVAFQHEISDVRVSELKEIKGGRV